MRIRSLKVKSEKPQKSDEFAQQLQYVNIFVENQPVTALIDSGCQIPVLNYSLIRLNKPSEGSITLTTCFGETRIVEVASINISLNQHSPSLSVRTAISPTLTEEFIIHPNSALVSMKRIKYRCGQRTVRLAVVESVVVESSKKEQAVFARRRS
ncbi:hypothetical protein TNCT_74121 [Trichonephila clavata]|uniref:Uncharacterized protein n=1 Tax=Trichonephila clavata TaxID=2740835 RepID=A0A8X6JL31_TRICU|nr:hypothetical protein TNCT_74121 [Trichonephila clavata]